MPLGIGSFLLYAQGPRSDLEVGYLSATINGATVTVNATETSPGFSIARTTNGVYAVTFPKCKYCKILSEWKPVAAADDRSERMLAGSSATAGTATVEIAVTLTGAATDPSSANNELVLIFLLGF